MIILYFLVINYFITYNEGNSVKNSLKRVLSRMALEDCF